MPVRWGFAPYALKDGPVPGQKIRYCAIDDFTTQILADGGDWKEAECLGDYAIVKVRASAATLTAINAAPGFIAIPDRFTDLSLTLGDLTTGERNALTNFLLARGFTQTEITTAIGNTNGAWRLKTLRQVLQFALSRWRRPLMFDGNGNLVFESQDHASGAPVTLDHANTVADG